MKTLPKLLKILCIWCITSNLVVAQSYRITPWSDNKKVAVTVTFDDNSSGQFHYGVPIMNARGIKATFFINSRTMDWELAQEAIATGHEIGNHTANHKNLVELDTAQIHFEIKSGYDSIKARLPDQNYVSFSYPGGQGRGFSPIEFEIRKYVKRYHINGRGIRKAGGDLGPAGYDAYYEFQNPAYDDYYYQTGTFSSDSSTIDRFNSAFSYALRNGGWFSPLYHGIESDGTLLIAAAAFEAQMDVIHSHSEEAWITTYGEATCYHKERQAAILQEIADDQQSWVLNLTDTLDDYTYQQPLTIRLALPDNLEIASITQNSLDLPYFIEGDTVQFNAVPDAGEIIVNKETNCNLGLTKVVTPQSDDNCNGTISLSVSGGTPPYTYLWSTGGAEPQESELCSGWYTVWVSDAQDCTVEDSIFVSTNDLPPGNLNNRVGEAVILNGSNLNKLIIYKANDLVGFSYNDGWQQIPIQVDEKDSVDGRTIYGNHPAEDFPELPWGQNLEKYVTVAYCDSNTWVGVDRDPNFDNNDELVFMVRDAGEAAPTSPPEGVNPESGVEVKITDPLTSTISYVYIFERTAPLDPSAGVSYVSYDFNLLSGDYKTTYKIPRGPNPEDSYISTAYYKQHFSDRFIRDGVHILAGNSSGINLIDRHRNLLDPALCFRSEDSFSNMEGAFQANINGPIRAIRSYYGANSGPLLQRDHFFYEQSDKVITRLQMHGIKGFLDIIDYAPDAHGMTYRNDKNLEGFAIDGIPDVDFDTTAYNWEQTFGPHGTWISFSKIAQNMDLDDHIFTYRQDDISPIDFQCTGDSATYGAVGIIINEKILNSDPRNDVFEFLNMYRESYYLAPEYNQVANVDEIIAMRNTPVETEILEWNNPYPQPGAFISEAISANKIRLTWQSPQEAVGFQLQRSENPTSNFELIAEPAAEARAYEDVALLPSTGYYYRLMAEYADGNSTWTNPSYVATHSDTCLSPLGMKSTVTGNTAVLQWVPALNASQYKVEYKMEGENTFFPPRYTADTFLILDGLTMDTTYIWQTTTVCDGESSFRSERQQITVGEPKSSLPPIAPSNLQVTAVTSTQVSLQWQNNADNDKGVVIERATTPNGIGGIIFNRRIKQRIESYTDKNLNPNFTYYYRVKATNENGDSDWSNQVVATTGEDGEPQECNPPSNTRFTGRTATTADLAWDPVEGAEAHEIYYRIVGESKVKKVLSSGNGTVTLTGLLPDTRYEWSIKTVCSISEKMRSAFAKRNVFQTLSDETNTFATSENEALKLVIFPNPSEGRIHVKASAGANEKLEVVIYNFMGIEVFRSEGMEDFDETIDLQAKGSQIYIAKVYVGNQTYTRQIIVR